MARAMTREREIEMARAAEIAAIGPEDSQRLHAGMNQSDASTPKRANKQPNMATGRRDGSPDGSTSQGLTSTSGSKRHASAGAGPSEPTPATAQRQAKRATTTHEGQSPAADEIQGAPTRRNDMDTKVNTKPMKGSKTRAKHFT